MRQSGGKLLLVILSSLVASLLMDRLLGLAGYPAEPPLSSAYPPGHVEEFDNIEFRYTVRANSLGLRDREAPLGKPRGARRVWVAGDSFTEGVGVEAGERFTDLLGARFRGPGRRIEWLNGGIHGTSPAKYGRLLLNAGFAYDLDGVLIALYANDLTETPDVDVHEFLHASARERRLHLKVLHALWPRTYTLVDRLKEQIDSRRRGRPEDFVKAVAETAAAQGVPAGRVQRWRSALPPELIEAANRGAFNGAMLSHGLLNPAYWSDPLEMDTDRAEARWRLMSETLSEIVAQCRRRGVEVALAFLPCVFQHDPESHGPSNPWVLSGARISREWLSGESALQRRLAGWAAGEGVPYLDLTPAFREASKRERLSYRLDFHWTPAGHRVAAEAIGEWLERGGAYSFVPGPAKIFPSGSSARSSSPSDFESASSEGVK